MIDLNKPVQTRGGRAVRIVATDYKNPDYPVLALVSLSGGQETVFTYTAAGRFSCHAKHPNDLVNIPAKRISRTFFVNVYSVFEDEICAYSTNEKADRNAGSGRVACVKMTFDVEEGTGL